MKVGDTVKLKPAMWQGIKPESYGLSFTGEYVVEQYIDMRYPAIKLEGFNGKWEAGAFQLVKEKEMSKFKVGDKVLCLSSDGFDGLVVGEVYTVSEIHNSETVSVKEVKDFVHYNKRFIEAASVQSTESKSALDVQVGGSHYKDKGIQPVEYCYQNNLGFLESNVVKYVSRHKDKNKADDIKKAIHYCKFILEFEYGIVE